MRSSARPLAYLVLWLIGLVLLVLMVKAFQHEAGDGREQHCNRVARTEAAIEGTDREEAKRQCMAAADRHAVFLPRRGRSTRVNSHEAG
jgi:hypothetical protein